MRWSDPALFSLAYCPVSCYDEKHRDSEFHIWGQTLMGMFLNSIVPYEKYKSISTSKYFVDKTEMIEELLSGMEGETQYICITRPRRFGKTVAANMLGAFLGKAADSSAVFDRLNIKRSDRYKDHLNRHNVIYIDFSEIPEKCSSYDRYITRIIEGLKRDLRQEYAVRDGALWDIMTDIFQETGEKYIFVMDEWDAVFHMPFVSEEEQREFLLFLKALLKSKVYVELAYMTGILPIAKYSDGSELNMFAEYNMAVKRRFGEYFGFLDREVDRLYEIYCGSTKEPAISRDDLSYWYDGYHTAGGEKMYNPRSVVCALTDNQLANYWTSSGTYDSVFGYIRDNVGEVLDEIALLFSGEAVPAKMQEYAAVSMQLTTRDEIYSAMVVYGLLTYEDGYVSIPNRELMDSFAAMMKKETSLGYVHRLAKESHKMLEATLAGDVEFMAKTLEYVHDTESPILSYNNETELAAVVNLAYLAARDSYRVEREDKAGKGYVDFIFYPVKPAADGIILELKVDGSPEEAIRQIKDKGYALRLKGRQGEKEMGSGRILAVGISYDRKSKKHRCKEEIL